jgi:NAD-dependent dihydropyrimidine dehydrogenase PreA subunit
VTFVITQPCIDTMDQSCVEVCPVDCIHFEEGADRMLYINPLECIDCGACQPACPVSAIFPEADVPADAAFFTEINSQWYEDAAAARARVAPLAGGGGEAVPAAAAASAPAAEDSASAPATAPAPAAAAASAPAASTPSAAAPAVPRRESIEDLGGYKYGENGVEGKCAVCGQYVVKGGVKFRQKSVLCPEDADKLSRLTDVYGKAAGRR